MNTILAAMALAALGCGGLLVIVAGIMRCPKCGEWHLDHAEEWTCQHRDRQREELE